jgi:hypothetical protein
MKYFLMYCGVGLILVYAVLFIDKSKDAEDARKQFLSLVDRSPVGGVMVVLIASILWLPASILEAFKRSEK